MSNSRSTAYTSLESLFLFQLLSKYGFINGSFDRIAQELQSTPLILEQSEYNASRLAPEALQQLALQLLSDEQRSEAEAAAEKGANGLSPASRKRKLPAPSLPTLKEAHEHPEKLSILIDRLYARFRDELVRQIREDERLYQQREREIDEIERGEWDHRIIQEQRMNDAPNNGIPNENGVRPATNMAYVTTAQAATPTPTSVPVQGPPPVQAPVPVQVQAPPVQTPVHAPVPIQAPVPAQPRMQEPTRRVEAAPLSAPPAVVARPAPAFAPAEVQTPTPAMASAPEPLPERIPLQPSPSSLAPATVPVTAPATATAMHSISEQRQFAPDIQPPLGPARPPGGAAPVLQHPQMAPGFGQRPASTPQLHVPDSVPRLENLPKANSPVPGQHGQAPGSSYKWEPLYQPSHPPPHQTPVPSPRPPYTLGPSRPPGYPPHVPSGPPQVPQTVPPTVPQTAAQSAPQQPQIYTGGRQPQGQAVSQPRFSTPGTNTSYPPVLLPPQHTGHIPPSLPSLPLNATPDGIGHHGPHQRPASTPVVASPIPNIPRNAYPQHQTAVLPPSTPIRPPSGLAATHPAIAAAKPPTQTLQPPQLPTVGRHPQPQPHPRPPPPQLPSVPTTPNQPHYSVGISRSYGAPYNPQAKLASPSDTVERPQLPIQTPVSTPQFSRPPSIYQAQTPVGASDAFYVIRGHGTKWTSTPTPSTPRVRDVEGYFDTDSPAFEPLSPPVQTTHLSKTFPDTENRGTSKPVTKTDLTRPRGRPPRMTQKAESTAEIEEMPAERDPAAPSIKNEETTPQTLQEAMGTAVNESPQSRAPAVLNTPSQKRKRQDTPLNRGPPTPATHVLWTRAFHKISMAALDQIIGHRYANMFANPIKPRLAPGYYDIILRPQDLKGIQKAITAGSKAAAATVATMFDVDSNQPAVWLPISIDLVPPRGIINIAQLERELIHMFANAIMYNPDPQRGLGPSFLRSYQSNSEEGEDLRGYEFDENGVVKETRNMFAEVEKLLGDLRNEVVPRAQPIGAGSRSVSAAIGESTNAEDDGGDDQAGDVKRRRIRG
ncbi:hypothetical protein F5Y14DRAFT_401128 [Nemania sp. NC0429]|nr:hypothetical protein F5Y14DRAFT_401128 [Nemania sp. NC0429]